MPKTKTTYFCQACGHQSAKWMGKCPACQEWNTFVEELVEKKSNGSPALAKKTKAKPQKISDISFNGPERIPAGDAELDRVLGGGIVPGSVVLLGGEPGIGKSTLLLQLALQLNKKVLYVSGEESSAQIRMRAARINSRNENCYILTETNTAAVLKNAQELQPELLIADSVQTLQSDLVESAPGSVSQIRQCAAELQQYAKESQVPVFLVGHINKEGAIAGPKVLEHIVDTVLQFEGDRHYNYRILRAVKNRFGSAAELGIYEMQSSGLRQVSNPSEILISGKQEPLSGIAIAATVEGMRPLLIEVQALVSPAVYGTPQRSATGFDLRRLNMLLAVLEKRCGFPLATKDVFLNIAGGIKVDDPGVDLAIVAALLSSFEDEPVDFKTCFAGEVGLSGEVRAVNKIEQRIAEAEKLGFTAVYISGNNSYSGKSKIKVNSVAKVEVLYRQLF